MEVPQQGPGTHTRWEPGGAMSQQKNFTRFAVHTQPLIFPARLMHFKRKKKMVHFGVFLQIFC